MVSNYCLEGVQTMESWLFIPETGDAELVNAGIARAAIDVFVEIVMV